MIIQKFHEFEDMLQSKKPVEDNFEDKGYIWEQLDEDSIKFKHDNEFINR
jgi:hypothetical protein